MTWFRTRHSNRLHRHDLKMLDSMLRVRMRNRRQMRVLAWSGGGIVAATLIGWGAWFALCQAEKRMFSENSFYQITNIAVESNGEALNQEWVAAYLRLRRGQNLMSLDLEELRRELEQLAVVEKAEISRELPGRLVVRVNERLPIATISAPIQNIRYQVDRHGVIMDMKAFPRTSDEFRKRLAELPRITGANVSELRIGRAVMSAQIFHALALIQKADQVDSRVALGIETVDVSRRGMLVVSTSEQAVVKVGLAAMDRQLKRLVAILNDARQRSLRIATVDLTAGRDVPVTFASAQ